MLYKYRGVKNFRFFSDIILNKRLYTANYFELNDPMEGHYLYHSGLLDIDIRHKINSEKRKIRICSLSKKCDNEIMWSHYSEGHRGVVIGVEIIETNHYDLYDVQYDGLPILIQKTLSSHSASEILSHKLDIWKYEEEVRIFFHKKYVSILIKELIFGRRMNTQDKIFLKKYINKVDPNIIIKNAEFNFV